MKRSEAKRESIKRDCLKMYVNGMGLRAIEPTFRTSGFDD
jgi:hypothetical protein